MSIFPAVPPELGAQLKFGGRLKKFPAFAPEFVPQLQNRVGAYDAMDFPGFGLSSG